MPLVTVEMQPGLEGDNTIFTVRLSEASLERVQLSYLIRSGNGFGSLGLNESFRFDDNIATLVFEPGDVHP